MSTTTKHDKAWEQRSFSNADKPFWREALDRYTTIPASKSVQAAEVIGQMAGSWAASYVLGNNVLGTSNALTPPSLQTCTNRLGLPGAPEINFRPYDYGTNRFGPKGPSLLGHPISFSIQGPTLKYGKNSHQWIVDTTGTQDVLSIDSVDLYSTGASPVVFTTTITNIYSNLYTSVGTTGGGLYLVVSATGSPGSLDDAGGGAPGTGGLGDTFVGQEAMFARTGLIPKDANSKYEIFRVTRVDTTGLGYIELDPGKRLLDYFDLNPAGDVHIIRAITFLKPECARVVAIPGSGERGKEQAFAIVPPANALSGDMAPYSTTWSSSGLFDPWSEYALLTKGTATTYASTPKLPIPRPLREGEAWMPGENGQAYPGANNYTGRWVIYTATGTFTTASDVGRIVRIHSVEQVEGGHLPDVSEFVAGTSGTPSLDTLIGYFEIQGITVGATDKITLLRVAEVDPETGVPFYGAARLLWMNTTVGDPGRILLKWTLHEPISKLWTAAHSDINNISSARLTNIIDPTWAGSSLKTNGVLTANAARADKAIFDTSSRNGTVGTNANPGSLLDLGFRVVLFPATFGGPTMYPDWNNPITSNELVLDPSITDEAQYFTVDYSAGIIYLSHPPVAGPGCTLCPYAGTLTGNTANPQGTMLFYVSCVPYSREAGQLGASTAVSSGTDTYIDDCSEWAHQSYPFSHPLYWPLRAQTITCGTSSEIILDQRLHGTEIPPTGFVTLLYGSDMHGTCPPSLLTGDGKWSNTFGYTSVDYNGGMFAYTELLGLYGGGPAGASVNFQYGEAHVSVLTAGLGLAGITIVVNGTTFTGAAGPTANPGEFDVDHGAAVAVTDLVAKITASVGANTTATDGGAIIGGQQLNLISKTVAATYALSTNKKEAFVFKDVVGNLVTELTVPTGIAVIHRQVVTPNLGDGSVGTDLRNDGSYGSAYRSKSLHLEAGFLEPTLDGGLILRVRDPQATAVTTLLGEVLSSEIISGGLVTTAGGLNINVAPSVILNQGKRQVVPAWSYTVPDDIVADQNGYVYYDISNSGLATTCAVVNHTTTLPLPTSADILLARVTHDGSNIISVVNLQHYLLDVDERVNLIVGDYEPEGTAPHFRTIGAALTWLGETIDPVATGGTAGSKFGKQWRILVVGKTNEDTLTTPLVIPCDGITIEGAALQTDEEASIVWNGDSSLFDFQGHSNLTFRNLSFHYTEVSACTGAPVRALFCNTTLTASHITIEKVHFDGAQAHAFLLVYQTSAWATKVEYLTIRDCVSVTHDSFVVVMSGPGLGIGDSWYGRYLLVENNKAQGNADHPADSSTAAGVTIQGDHNDVKDNDFYGFYRGVYFFGTAGYVVTNNKARNNKVATTHSGLILASHNDHFCADSNWGTDLFTGALAGRQLLTVEGRWARVLNNRISLNGVFSSDYAIHVTGSDAEVSGNVVDASILLAGNTSVVSKNTLPPVISVTGNFNHVLDCTVATGLLVEGSTNVTRGIVGGELVFTGTYHTVEGCNTTDNMRTTADGLTLSTISGNLVHDLVLAVPNGTAHETTATSIQVTGNQLTGDLVLSAYSSYYAVTSGIHVADNHVFGGIVAACPDAGTGPDTACSVLSFVGNTVVGSLICATDQTAVDGPLVVDANTIGGSIVCAVNNAKGIRVIQPLIRGNTVGGSIICADGPDDAAPSIYCPQAIVEGNRLPYGTPNVGGIFVGAGFIVTGNICRMIGATYMLGLPEDHMARQVIPDANGVCLGNRVAAPGVLVGSVFNVNPPGPVGPTAYACAYNTQIP